MRISIQAKFTSLYVAGWQIKKLIHHLNDLPYHINIWTFHSIIPNTEQNVGPVTTISLCSDDDDAPLNE